jgi:DNA-binding response OmpR family regulator
MKMRSDGVILPIVALTAELPNEIDKRIREAGIDDAVLKPFLPDELYRKVLHHIYQSADELPEDDLPKINRDNAHDHELRQASGNMLRS